MCHQWWQLMSCQVSSCQERDRRLAASAFILFTSAKQQGLEAGLHEGEGQRP
jgi:hypothetical protein